MATIKRWNGSAWEYVGVPSAVLTTDTAQTISGLKTFSTSPVFPDASIPLVKLNATGTRDATTYLRGDGTWQVVSGSAPANMVTTDTVQTITAAKIIRTNAVPAFGLEGAASATQTIAMSFSRSSGTVDGWVGTVGTTKFLSDDVAGDFAFRVNNTTNTIRFGAGTSSAAATAFQIGASGIAAYQPVSLVSPSLTALGISGISTNTGTIALAWGRNGVTTEAWLGVVGATKFFSNDTAADFSIRANTATGAINLGYGTASTGAAALKISSAGVVAGINLYEGANRVYSAGNLVPIAGISATGTKDSTTYLRGDGVWSTVSAAAPSNMVTTDTTQTITGIKTFSADVTASTIASSGLVGSTIPSRYVGGTTGSAPVSGTYLVGDWIVGVNTGGGNPTIYICTVAGTPGTWVSTTTGLASLAAAQTWTQSQSYNASIFINSGYTFSVNSGAVLRFEPTTAASSGTPLVGTSTLRFRPAYWNGSVSVTENFDVTAIHSSAAAGSYYLSVPGGVRATSVYDNSNRVYSASNLVPVAGMSATGTKDATTYLRGDNIWTTISAPTNMATTDTAQTIVAGKIFTGTTANGGVIELSSSTGAAKLLFISGGATPSLAFLSLQAAKLDGYANLAWGGALSGTAVYEGSTRVYSPNNPPPAGGASVVSKTGAYTAVSGEVILASGTFTVTIPITANSQITVKNIGTGTITIAPASGTIDGAATFPLDSQYASVSIVSDGTNAYVV